MSLGASIIMVGPLFEHQVNLEELFRVIVFGAMVDEHKELVFNRESEHCVFPLDFNGRVPGGPSARFSVS